MIKTMWHEKLGVLAVILVGSTLTCTGCSSGNTHSSGDDRQARLVMNVVSIFYGEYLESHRGKPPQSSDEFRQYLESRPENLKRYKVENLDQLMTSSRDGQPLVIVCGKRRLAPADSPGTPWAAYEQTGVEGKKMAVQVRGGVHELSNGEVAQIFQNN